MYVKRRLKDKIRRCLYGLKGRIHSFLMCEHCWEVRDLQDCVEDLQGGITSLFNKDVMGKHGIYALSNNERETLVKHILRSVLLHAIEIDTMRKSSPSLTSPVPSLQVQLDFATVYLNDIQKDLPVIIAHLARHSEHFVWSEDGLWELLACFGTKDDPVDMDISLFIPVNIEDTGTEYMVIELQGGEIYESKAWLQYFLGAIPTYES